MKFKLIFIVFNILIIGSFLLLLFMPAFLVGWDFAGSVWNDSWYLSVLFIIFVGALNFYFIFNWHFFSLLESETWPELVDYLHTEFFRKSRGKRGLHLNRSRIRVFLNACVVSSRVKNIGELADFLKEKQPALYSEFLLTLGLPHLLNEEPGELESFYGQVYKLNKVKEKPWCIWIHSFSLLLQKKDGAMEGLSGLLSEKDPILRLLSVYLIGLSGEENELVDESKERLKIELTPGRFESAKEKNQGNVLFFALTNMIEEANTWLVGSDAVKTVDPGDQGV